jgi:hypothetical protein
VNLVRWIRRCRLTPLLSISLGNVLVWFWLVVPTDGSSASLAALATIAIVAGINLPREPSMLWFAALCLMVPELFIRSREHGAGIDYLLGGFVFPPLWIYLFMNFMPYYLVTVVFVWIGYLTSPRFVCLNFTRSKRLSFQLKK